MIPLYTAAETRALEAACGLPVELLMENAGAAVARAALATGPGPYAVVCGGGNNGGDGLVCARHLLARGAAVRVAVVGRGAYAGAAAANRQRLPVEPVDLAAALDGAGTIVDCLLGTGFQGPVRPPLDAAVARLNGSGLPILACDLPSGLDADGARPEGPCVRARRTLCLLGMKRGCAVYPGAAWAGAVEVDPLGAVLVPSGTCLAEAADARRGVPPRRPEAHKNAYGHVVVLAGSPGYTGAPALAARAALAAGSGLVTLGVPAEVLPVLAAKLDEVMVRPLSPDLLRAADVAVVGPGLGRSPEAAEVVRAALASGLPVVLDADGLNLTRLEELAAARGPVVITPHPGEMARLLGGDAAGVQADRFGAARRAAEEGRCVAVLKGARTLVAVPGGVTWVNPTGNDGMATAGSGDVLAGLIGGLAAQGAAPADAALAGVYLHGLAGDAAAGHKGRYALVAGDLTACLPEAFARAGCEV